MNVKSFETLGIYTVPDVSRILGLPYSKIQYWISEYWSKDFSFNTGNFITGHNKDRVTNFYALIEFYTFSQLRNFGVPTKSIVCAHNVISDKLGTSYPFATSTILTDGKRVFFSNDKEESIIHADKTLQFTLVNIIRLFCEKIDFENDMAYRFWPKGKLKSVVIDPEHQFGQPIISETNILAETLYLLYKGGESIQFISNLYEIPPKKIIDAIDFYKKAA
jgi:uncharacterized protein (DUF433 family)